MRLPDPFGNNLKVVSLYSYIYVFTLAIFSGFLAFETVDVASEAEEGMRGRCLEMKPTMDSSTLHSFRFSDGASFGNKRGPENDIEYGANNPN